MAILPPVETTPILWLRFTNDASSKIIDLVKQRLEKCRIIILSSEYANDDSNDVVLYLTTHQHDLKLEAHQTGLVKTAKLSDIPKSLIKLEGHDIIKKAYNMKSKDDFTVSTDSKKNKFSGYDSEKLFSSSDRARLLRSMVESITILDEGEKVSLLAKEFDETRSSALSIYLCDILREYRLIDAIYPVHIPHLKEQLWTEGMRLLARIPLQGLRDYYGEEVAFYFAWQEFYMYSLIFPGMSGLVIFVLRSLRGDSVDNCVFTPFHGLITFIWATVFLKLWSRQENRLAYSWGTLKSQAKGRGVNSMRHEFKGSPCVSQVTGEETRYYSPLKRSLKYAISASVTMFLLSGAFFLMIMSLNLQGYIHDTHDDQWGNGLAHPFHFPSVAIYAIKGGLFDPSTYWSYIPIILHSSGVFIMNMGYRIVAEKLTEWENHETCVSHQNSLILKRFFFEACDAYLILFYLAFYEQNVMQVRLELVSLFHIDTFRRILCEGVIPLIFQKASTRDKNTKIAAAKKKDEVKKDISTHDDIDKDEYEEFDDYIESVIQFGYVTLFASAYPLASFVAIVACSIEYRLDLFKLTKLCIRPNSVLRNDIGIWKHLMKAIVWLSAFTNCLIFCFSSRQMYQYLPSYFTVDESGEHDLKAGSGVVVVFFVFAIERFLVLLGVFIDFAISSIPRDVSIKEERRDYIYFRQHQCMRSVLCNTVESKADNFVQ